MRFGPGHTPDPTFGSTLHIVETWPRKVDVLFKVYSNSSQCCRPLCPAEKVSLLHWAQAMSVEVPSHSRLQESGEALRARVGVSHAPPAIITEDCLFVKGRWAQCGLFWGRTAVTTARNRGFGGTPPTRRVALWRQWRAARREGAARTPLHRGSKHPSHSLLPRCPMMLRLSFPDGALLSASCLPPGVCPSASVLNPAA